MDQDNFYMNLAIEQAEQASVLGEVPIGAVLVFNDKVIAKAHNQVEMQQDATAHAEVLCLQMATKILGNWRLHGATLYCTLEPCAMCAGAMFLSRIDTLVFGAPDHRHGAHGSWCNLFATAHPTHSIEVRQGILAPACGALLKTFFKNKRINSAKDLQGS